MRFTWRTEWPHWLILAGMFALATTSWGGAPDRIPAHWGLDGQVDRYSGKIEGILLLPILAAGIYLVFLLLPRLDPGRANYPSFAGAYAVVRLSVLVVLGVIYGLIHAAMRGHDVSVGGWMSLTTGALLVVVGNQFGKIRPNWFVGFRTPWTLSSKVAWTRTHRAAGWMLVAAGMLLLAHAVLRVAWLLHVMLGVVLLGLVARTVYSYVLWRNDPEKTPPAGTLPAGN